ncbi:MAG: endopeptidase La [Planctomycetota bacterium]|nr:MAG: endopeptidase La [Planctomycetota bacterium]
MAKIKSDEFEFEINIENLDSTIELDLANLPNKLIVLPVHPKPFFPGMLVPVSFPPGKFHKAITIGSKSKSKCIGLVLVDEDKTTDFEAPKLMKVGVAGKIVNSVKNANGDEFFLVNCLKRFRITNYKSDNKLPIASVKYLDDVGVSKGKRFKAMRLAITGKLKNLVKLNPSFREELNNILSGGLPDEPGQLADLVSVLSSNDGLELQRLLEELNVKDRLKKTLYIVSKELEVSILKEKIQNQVDEKIGDSQRTFFLREQLKQIKEELGLEKDEKSVKLENFRLLLKNKDMSEEAKVTAQEEIDKMSMLETSSPEYGITVNYLDWLLKLPWGAVVEENLSIKKARNILNSDHDGIDDAKKRILEFIGASKLLGSTKGAIICLTGPPGVGKTSFGKSVAKALGRPLYRFSVGGLRDEAEIKGHRRTYVGAMPGKFVQALKRTEKQNPVILLDEIDKISSSIHGDPASALLEALDPEQNSEFHDHYLDVRIDLSHVLFICTANALDTIPEPLLDRMEIIRMNGYIMNDKIKISKNHLIPRLIKRNGLRKKDFKIENSALKLIINGYAREAGVRNLEKRLASLCRHAAARCAENGRRLTKINEAKVKKILGEPFYVDDLVNPDVQPGEINGLAWTNYGGTNLLVESIVTSDDQKSGIFKQTGQLGDVMKESSQIAYSYIKANIGRYGGDAKYFDTRSVHLHVPAGGTPKDGPSAGITMASSLLSLCLNKAVSTKIGMTGELTLNGRVLPIGGIQEKVIAAKRVGITTLIFPIENKGSFEELKDYIKSGLHVYFTSHYDQVINVLFPKLVKNPAGKIVIYKKSKK